MNTSLQSENIRLLSALKESNRKAFDKLFKIYYPMLCGYCRRFVSWEDAEEIVQDVMLWLWENRETLSIEHSLTQYLFKMCYRKALNRLEYLEVRNRANAYFFEESQNMLQNISVYQIEELSKRIHKAIATLPESYREAFEMHRFRNMSYKEIATALDVSTQTVGYRIQQALKLLRHELKDYFPLLLILLKSTNISS